MTELIVIRHGETDWNRQQRFQGQIDVPLNEFGREQAARLAERLAEEPIDALVVSDLQRAHSTAEAIVRRRSSSLPQAALQVEPLWREQSFGLLEGMAVGAIREQHAALWEQWIRHDADYALPGGGESNRDFFGRVQRAVQALLDAHAGRRVVVVTHGGVLDMLWRGVRGLSLHGPRACDIPNTGINRLRWHEGSLQIVRWAEVDHLQGLPAQPSTAPAAGKVPATSGAADRG